MKLASASWKTFIGFPQFKICKNKMMLVLRHGHTMQVYLNQVESLGFVDLLPAMKPKHRNLARHHWSLRESEPRVLKWRKHFSLRTWIVTKSRRQCLESLIQRRIDVLCRGTLAKLSLLTSQNSRSLFCSSLTSCWMKFCTITDKMPGVLNVLPERK